MNEQLPIPLNNNQYNNQQNIVVQSGGISQTELQIQRIQKLKSCTGCIFCAGCILTLYIVWHLFVWFMAGLGSILSYNYQTHKDDIEKKYFNRLYAFIGSNLPYH